MLAPALHHRLQLAFALDVREGLSKAQKELPSQYLYDEVGTALFEVITRLPEYGLTRADERLLREHAGDLLDRLASPLIVAELGSGAGTKTRWILEELARRQYARYYPIDISASALAQCRKALADIDCLHITSLEQSYSDGLQEVTRRRSGGEGLLVLFLGSTIGNFDREAARQFLREMREVLQSGDALLLGADLVKPAGQVLAAYNDSIGVTAAFNLNLLARINRELDADFDLRLFQHEARYNAKEKRIEMHLRSQTRQTVDIRSARFRFTLRAGETIWTEASYKFEAAELREMAAASGFRCVEQWIDAEWPFAENLFVVE